MTRINVFICNTPFQHYIISHLINNNIVLKGKNIILSTFKSGKLLSPRQANVYEISNSLRSIFFYYELNNEIKRHLRKNCEVQFFYPHLNNFLSSIFFRKFEAVKNVSHNCYYEGIALFYNPIIFPSKKKTVLNRIKCIILGERYYKERYFFPEELRNVAIAFSPKALLTSNFKSIIEFNLSKENNLIKVLNENQNSEKSLLIILPSITNEFEYEEYKRLFDKLLLNMVKEVKLFLKPHFELSSKHLSGFEKCITQHIFEILDNEINIESYAYEFSEVIGLYPSSALINLKLISPETNITTYDFLNSIILNIGEETAGRLRSYFIKNGIKLLASCE